MPDRPLDLAALRRVLTERDQLHVADHRLPCPVCEAIAEYNRLVSDVLPALLDLVERLAEVVREAVDHPALMGLHTDEPDCVLCVWREKARAMLV